MRIATSRFVLRDFEQADLAAFLGYQTDPRYRRLYDLDESYAQQASDLFSLFLAWQQEEPRRNFQLGIFERGTGRLCGCAGLRGTGAKERHAVLGIELAPDDWGRYRLAVEVASALIGFGFRELGLDLIIGSTASGNRRVERLARWFGAEIIAERAGADWMKARGWVEVDWALSRSRWESTEQKGRPLSRMSAGEREARSSESSSHAPPPQNQDC
jgi:ribosomal-protein-alanine N-acetyltransferase